MRTAGPDRQQYQTDQPSAALRQEAPIGSILTATERATLMQPFRYDVSAA